MTKTERLLAQLNGTLDKEYSALVSRKIRARYSLSDELALSRQRDAKPEEWEAYNAYCEKCKADAKRETYGEEGNV